MTHVDYLFVYSNTSGWKTSNISGIYKNAGETKVLCLAAGRKRWALKLCGLYNSQRKANTRNPFTADTSITNPLCFLLSIKTVSSLSLSNRKPPDLFAFDTDNTNSYRRVSRQGTAGPKIKSPCPGVYRADGPVSYTDRSQEILQHSSVLDDRQIELPIPVETTIFLFPATRSSAMGPTQTSNQRVSPLPSDEVKFM